MLYLSSCQVKRRPSNKIVLYKHTVLSTYTVLNTYMITISFQYMVYMRDEMIDKMCANKYNLCIKFQLNYVQTKNTPNSIYVYCVHMYIRTNIYMYVNK